MDKALVQLLILLKLKKEDVACDWMGFKVTEDNYLTGHHITSRSDGGEDSVNNIALLSLLSHRYLHECIELYNPEIFKEINDILRQVCVAHRMPNENEHQRILYLMYEFEKKHKKVLKGRISNLNINPKIVNLYSNIIDVNTPHGYRILLQNGIDPIKRHKEKVKKKKHKSDSY